MFAQLQCSERKYYDTRSFCNACQVVTGEQQDVDEWMGNLFDKLEQNLKHCGKDKIFNEFFGTKMVYQVISRDCTHISEREESGFSLALEIQGKKNLSESLKNFIQEDNLVGDNKYHCAPCGQKVIFFIYLFVYLFLFLFLFIYLFYLFVLFIYFLIKR